jgi:hypothetical protein
VLAMPHTKMAYVQCHGSGRLGGYPGRLSVSYCLSDSLEKASLVWKDQSRQVGMAAVLMRRVHRRSARK